MKNEKQKILEIVLVILFFSSFLFSISKPVSDSDIFWHIKTGEWIYENRSLPDKNPFSFTGSGQDELAEKFTLKQYWLAQLVIFGFYRAAGFYGIIALRHLLYIGIVLILYRMIRNKGISVSASILFLTFPVYFSTIWFGERPNNLSFLLAVILIYLLEGMNKAYSEQRIERANDEPLSPTPTTTLHPVRYTLLPLVMLLWANMHGGFIFGVAIIVLYMITEGVRLLSGRGKDDNAGKRRLFFIICTTSILITLVNPNTYKVIPIILKLSGSVSYKISSEMRSTIEYANSGDYRGLMIIAALALPVLLRIRQLGFRRLLIYAFFTALALSGERYMPFLVFISIPIIAELWGKSLDGISEKMERFYVPVLAVFVFSAFLCTNNFKDSVFKNPVIAPYYPEAAVEFIKSERPQGNLFNDYNNGGFLLLSLWPDYKVFIDSRGLIYESSLPAYEKVMFLGSLRNTGGIPEWKKILKEYNINTILIPAVDTRNTGFFVRLIRRLAEDGEWHLVFVDKEALLFIRNTEKNRRIIRLYSQPKLFAYMKAIEQAELYRFTQPYDWKVYLTLGEINLYIARPKIALQCLESAVKLNSSLKSTSLNNLMDILRDGKDYTSLMNEIFREPR